MELLLDPTGSIIAGLVRLLQGGYLSGPPALPTSVGVVLAISHINNP